MLKLIQFFSTKELFSNLILIFVFILGLFSIFKIKRELFPNVNFDLIMINTIYPGASSSEVEKLITNSLEQELKEIDGIRSMRSYSSENRSSILLELDPDEAKIEAVKSEAQEVIDRLSDLPEGAEDPVIESLKSQSIPIIEISLFSPVVSHERKREVALILERKIESLSEVARVEFQGLRDYEIKVEVYPEKLKLYDLSLEDIISALQFQNYSIPGGVIQRGKVQKESADSRKREEILLRTKGEFKDKGDVEQTVIRANALAKAIRVRDVAEVSLGFKKEEAYFKLNGVPSINLTILKKENADAIKLVHQVKELTDFFFKDKRYEKLTKDLGYEYVDDRSYLIKRRLKVLMSNFAIGLGLVFFVLSFVFSWRLALLTGLGIPFSIFGTLMCFHFFGISINLVSLMGLIIVTGMLVDDAVVVIENCQRHVEAGLEPLKASVLGAYEMFTPVMSSVFTSILAFLPLVFMSGIFGKFMKFMPIGVVLALLISLLECFFILPHHFHQWGVSSKGLKSGKKEMKKSKMNRLNKKAWMESLVSFYLKILDQVLRLRWGVVLLTFCFFIFSIYFAVKKMRFVLFPKGGIETFVINAEGEIGLPLGETLKLVDSLEEEIKKLPKEEVKSFATKVGIQQMSILDPSVRRGGRFIQVIVYLTPFTQRKRSSYEILSALKEKVGLPQGFKEILFFEETPGPPVGKPIDVGIRGKKYIEINRALLDLKEHLKKVDGVLNLESTFLMGKKELQIEVNRAEMSAAGLNIFQVGRNIRASFEGIVATTITEVDEEIDVRVSLFGNEAVYKDPKEAILNLSVPSPRYANQIPLRNILKVKETQSVASYQHKNNARQVSLQGEVDTKIISSRKVNEKIREIIKRIQKAHPSVSFHFGGEDQDTRESLQTLVQSFLIAMMFIAIILILTFQSLLQPLLVLSSVPIGIMAVIWTFYFHDLLFKNYPLSFLCVMGVIAVSGVIVNNAIIFIDFANRKQREGFLFFDSIKQAGRYRIRPILLTTVTTSAGLLPTAYGWGGLDPFIVPIALALGWGILFGAFLTTLVLPALLGVSFDISSFVKKRFRL